MLGAEDALGPARRDCGVTAEIGDVEPAGDGEIVVPAETQCGPLAHEGTALVRMGAVADDVSEAPHLVRAFTQDVGEHGLEGVQVPVDVGDDGGAHDQTLS